jgi:hypothetical protein
MNNVSTGDIFKITCLPWEDLLGGMSPLKTFPGGPQYSIYYTWSRFISLFLCYLLNALQ